VSSVGSATNLAYQSRGALIFQNELKQFNSVRLYQMKHHRIIPLLFVLFLSISGEATKADGLSTNEYVAFMDFMIPFCSENEPDRASDFQKLRNPPYACMPDNQARNEQARHSADYRALADMLTKENSNLSKEEITKMCKIFLEARC